MLLIQLSLYRDIIHEIAYSFSHIHSTWILDCTLLWILIMLIKGYGNGVLMIYDWNDSGER